MNNAAQLNKVIVHGNLELYHSNTTWQADKLVLVILACQQNDLSWASREGVVWALSFFTKQVEMKICCSNTVLCMCNKGNTSPNLFHAHFLFFTLDGPLRGDKVSVLTHIYPHKPLRKIKVTTCNHQADSPLYVCVMSDLVICKFWKSMVIHDTECRYWDQVSLNNTNPRGLASIYTPLNHCRKISLVVCNHKADCPLGLVSDFSALQPLQWLMSLMTPNGLSETSHY